MASQADVRETSGDRFAAQRATMVASQLRTTGVDDARVIAAMARVPRERFVPQASGDLAYRDTGVPLGGGRMLNSPMATALLLNAAQLSATDRVLLIGAAGGYAAAVLAQLVAHVVAVESDPALAEAAREALAGVTSVEVVAGPLDEGHAESAPYDVMVVDGAVPRLSDALVGQLAAGGRCVAGLVERGVTRLASGARTAHGFALVPFADAEVALLPGFAQPTGFSFGG